MGIVSRDRNCGTDWKGVPIDMIKIHRVSDIARRTTDAESRGAYVDETSTIDPHFNLDVGGGVHLPHEYACERMFGHGCGGAGLSHHPLSGPKRSHLSLEKRSTLTRLPSGVQIPVFPEPYDQQSLTLRPLLYE